MRIAYIMFGTLWDNADQQFKKRQFLALSFFGNLWCLREKLSLYCRITLLKPFISINTLGSLYGNMLLFRFSIVVLVLSLSLPLPLPCPHPSSSLKPSSFIILVSPLYYFSCTSLKNTSYAGPRCVHL